MLVIYPAETVALYPRLFGEISYYAGMASYAKAIVNTSARFDKRHKETHRYTIADTRGRLQLTVPIKKPDISAATWNDISISDHGNWWQIHRTSLESAYGRTPFFEFYIDRLLPLMQSQGSPDMPDTVGALIRRADSIIREILNIETEITYADIDCDSYDNVSEYPVYPEYYQIRNATLGFIPNLSILD
ncbi:MAG: WbqC family protein, partial [Muribaculaceae bacterium]|nr:WbqC family protein [Muribaculaceae bacterium]